jgi:membrane-associated phospholipid phosphatase
MLFTQHGRRAPGRHPSVDQAAPERRDRQHLALRANLKPLIGRPRNTRHGAAAPPARDLVVRNSSEKCRQGLGRRNGRLDPERRRLLLAAAHPTLRMYSQPSVRGSTRFFSYSLRALLLGAVFLGCVAVMAAIVPAGPSNIDQTWAEAMGDSESAALTQIALIFNTLGRGLGTALTVGAVCLLLLIARRWLALLAFATVETLTPVLTSLLKATIGRPRPPDAMIHPLGSAFPSGHAAYAAATAIAFVVLFTSPGPRRNLWWSLAGLATAGMAWSRTYLQVHWLSDVFGGSLLGAGIALVVFAVTQLLADTRQDLPQAATITQAGT